VKEVWIFDCFYNDKDDDNWVAWKKDNAGNKLVVRYTTGGGTEARSKALDAKLNALKGQVSNYDVKSSGIDHDVVPLNELEQLIKDSKTL
jgi:hypothetical protein